MKGGTGCGKTTQVPQFLLEEAAATQQKVRIICTQPRRLPAIAVAERVAKERGEDLPGAVGYHIRLEQKTKYETVLTYCTSGVLSRLLTIDAIAKNVSHIILDEIHEREQNTDYLLIALREALHVRKDLKVILMSATMEGNRETFLKYFKNHSIGVVDIPSRLHNVDKFFLGDVLAMTSYLSGNSEAAPVTGAFPQVEQWAHHDRSSAAGAVATVAMPLPPCNTAPDLNQYGYPHAIHPSASTPSLQITDPIEQIATQITNSQSFVRQSSLYNDSTTAYPTVAAATPYDNYAQQLPGGAPTQNGFYFEGGNGYSNGYLPHETTFNSGFRTNMIPDPMATLCQISSQIGPQPRKFDKEYANNLSRSPYSRETLCDLYNQCDSRYFSNPDIIDHDLIVHVINFLMDSEEKGSILVFLPGYDDILAIPYPTVAAATPYDNYAQQPPGGAPTQNGFYFEGGNGFSNGYLPHETTFNSGFRTNMIPDPMATLCQISSQIGPQPRKFDKEYANNLSRSPYSRETLCDLYNQCDSRYFSNPDIIDHDLIVHVINFLMDSEEKGSILVFLPGYDDILAIRDRLRDHPCTQTRPEIYTLHSQMNSLDQQRVFEEIKDIGARKVILSTNIAE
uniref:Helicase ATP-binding domain-containing protein n=1 Tax=Panagrolaimus sp. ES5 TaxID=591445 RepID=A0AC34G2T0_9BILA